MAVEKADIRTLLKRYLSDTSLDVEDYEVTSAALMELISQKGGAAPVYEVVLLGDDQHGGDWCIFWRDHKDVTKGDHEVLMFWASFGPEPNKAKHTADILNGKFPAF